MRVPRLMLTAGASGSGKTLLTCGLLQVMKNRGLDVRSFKCGPDYIDPMFHAKVIGAPSRNLDTFFTGEAGTRNLLARNGADCDIAILEGVMGYYDGLAGISTDASAYDVARVTDTPAVLIVNCKGMSVSILPYIKGFLEFKSDSQIKGVILNQMTPMLYPRVKQMIEEALPVKVYGYVPKLVDCVLESRHLGLVLPNEVEELQEKLQKLALVLEESLDVEGLLQLARENEELDAGEEIVDGKSHVVSKGIHVPLRIAVARDEAFCFIYEDNMQMLRDMGAELVVFSPIHDQILPENIQGILLYGGYPELYAKTLSENVTMRESIRKAIAENMPCIAECGGFMYLMDSLESMEKKAIDKRAVEKESMQAEPMKSESIEPEYYPMVGAIAGKAFRTEKLSRFGYVTLSGGKVFGEEVGAIPAHEFHYFDTTNNGTDFHADKPLSKRGWDCIYSSDTLFAGFPHIHYYGNLGVAQAFVSACERYKEREDNDT